MKRYLRAHFQNRITYNGPTVFLFEGVEEGGKKEVEVEENKEPEAQVEVAEVLEEAPTPPVEEEAPPIVLAVEGAPAV